MRHAFYTEYGQKEGLGNGVISDIIQDHTGFIWIATYNGLFRFDGAQFRSFTHDPDDPTTLSHNQIRAMVVDSTNRIWIATDGGGLSMFDPEKEKFRSWIVEPNFESGVPQRRAQSVFVDHKDRVWVGTEDEGFCRYNEDSDSFSCYEVVPGAGYPYNVALAFANDPNNGNDSATDTNSVIRSSDLSVTKTDGRTDVNAGGSLV
ncbi:MAG: two-component regulator propeller domain-containing protein, partial [Bacteroidota bacterium]